MAFGESPPDTRIPVDVRPVGRGGLSVDTLNQLRFFLKGIDMPLMSFLSQVGLVRPGSTSGVTNMTTNGILGGALLTLTNNSGGSIGSQGVAGNFATPASIGGIASFAQTAGLNQRRDQKPFYLFRFKLSQTSAERFFVGIMDVTTAAAGTATDDPAAGYFGLQFSTNRADTNFQLSRKDTSGGTQVLVDTGVAPNTSEVYTFIIDDDGTNVISYLLDSNLSLLWSSASLTTTLIPSTTLIGIRWIIESLALAAKSFQIYGTSGVLLRTL